MHVRPRVASLFVAVAPLLIFSLIASVPMWSQAVDTGNVAGTITDPSSAIVQGAKVTITNPATADTRSTISNEAGHYIFPNVPPGMWNLTVTKVGFSTTKSSIQVKVGLTETVNLALQVGGANITVEVQAAGTELQTMNATVGNTVTGLTLESLPSIQRDVSTFIELQPGVSPDGSVAGTVVDQSTFMLDGGNNTSDMDGSMTVYTGGFGGDPTGGIVGNQIGSGASGVMPTPVDSVEEFKVNTTGQTADFNSSAGAQIQVVTKRGTNTWHGTAYEYYLDNNFNANTWDNNLSGTKLPSYHYSRYGGSVGGTLLPNLAGGKTYFFVNIERFRWPNSTTIERSVPSANMVNGILTFGGSTYNIKTYDDRGIGISPIVQKMWQTQMPAGNDTTCGTLLGSRCDGVNTIGFKANMSVPFKSNFAVARLDHDFGSKWHFMASYRYFHLTNTTTDEIDIGGVLPGDKLGVPSAVSTKPSIPSYYVAGLTTNISPTVTNDFHWSFLRNWWAWNRAGDPAQLAGLGGALEPLGEQHYTALTPYNVNTQQTRTRFWDGQDHMLRDDVTVLKGNHLFQFGGTYQHNFNWHQRTDNGGGINYYPVYQLGDSNGAGLIDLSTYNGGASLLKTAPGFGGRTFGRDVAAVLGMVTESQIAYTRSGASLTLNPPLTPAFDQSTIPFYNVYFSDTWHLKPTFTFTYGLGWTMEMPPTEKNGKQVELVDANVQQVSIETYLNQRKKAALQGQVYNPILGYDLVGNTGKGQKYPYNPFYGSFSPRIAVAWNPRFDSGSFMSKMFGTNDTVLRGGYGRIYGRLNGVDLVLVPLLGTGLIQPVQCRQALNTGGGACGPAIPDVGTAFRVGPDGLTAPLQAASPTLPQPLFPGINNVSAAAGEALDPNFRPNVVDSFDLTLQRQLSSKISLEVGYIGRRITHEYQPINTNAVPYMMTLGGQTFASAYAAVEKANGCATSQANCGSVTPKVGVNGFTAQPFFEAALSGTGYCTGYATCTDAIIQQDAAGTGAFGYQGVWDLWSGLDNGGIGGGPGGTTLPGWNFPRSMLNSPLYSSPNGASGQISGGVGDNASVGFGNYNAGFISVKMNDWHGFTSMSNLTFSKALGTGAFVQATSSYTPNDPFNLKNMYGSQNFDRKIVFNTLLAYQPPYFKGQHGAMGRLLGGWTLAPIFTAGSGAPLYCNTPTDAESFGSADGVNFGTNEQCLFTSTAGVSNKAHYGFPGVFDTKMNCILACPAGGTASTQVNIYSDPLKVWNNVRPPILGLDTRDAGVGQTRGLPYFNMDMSIKKNIRIFERVNLDAQFVFTNVLNHNQFYDPGMNLSSPTAWGVLNAQGNNPRQLQFGIRASF